MILSLLFVTRVNRQCYRIIITYHYYKPILAHAYERKIVCRVAGNKETFAGWQAGGRAEGCARDTGGGRPWPLQQMLDRSAATATAAAGRVLLRLDYTLTRILYILYYYIRVRFAPQSAHVQNAARARNAQCIHCGGDVAVVVLYILQ